MIHATIPVAHLQRRKIPQASTSFVGICGESRFTNFFKKNHSTLKATEVDAAKDAFLAVFGVDAGSRHPQCASTRPFPV
jgi:hypothetical protein